MQCKESHLTPKLGLIVLRQLDLPLTANQLSSLSQLAENLLKIVCVVSDHFSQTLYVNQEFEKIFELSRANEVISELIIDSYVHKEDLSRWLTWRKEINSIKSSLGEFRFVGRSGHIRWLNTRLFTSDSLFPNQNILPMPDVTSTLTNRGNLKNHFRERNQTIWGLIEYSSQGNDLQIPVKRIVGDDRLLSRFQNHPLPTMCWRLEQKTSSYLNLILPLAKSSKK